MIWINFKNFMLHISWTRSTFFRISKIGSCRVEFQPRGWFRASSFSYWTVKWYHQWEAVRCTNVFDAWVIKLCVSFRCKVIRRASPQFCTPMASPPRPSFLPISEPIPVPSQRLAFERMQSQEKNEKSHESSSPLKVSWEISYKEEIQNISLWDNCKCI